MNLTVRIDGLGHLLSGPHMEVFQKEIANRKLNIRVTQEKELIPIITRSGHTTIPGDRSIEFEGRLLPGDARAFLVLLGMALYDGEFLEEARIKDSRIQFLAEENDRIRERLEKYEPKVEEDDAGDYRYER